MDIATQKVIPLGSVGFAQGHPLTKPPAMRNLKTALVFDVLFLDDHHVLDNGVLKVRIFLIVCRQEGEVVDRYLLITMG